MKRMKYLLLFFCFLLMGQPLFVEAKDLSESEQMAVSAVYQCLKSYESYVDLSEYNIPYSDQMATTLLDTALDQDLYLFNTLANVTDLSDDFCGCYTSEGYFTGFEFDYGNYNAATLQNQYHKLKEKTQAITKSLKLSQLSREQAVLAVHDYIALHTDYDDSASPKRISYTAYGALVNGQAVCSGYSTACELLLSTKNIPVIIASSDAMDHAWNVVKLGKHWYHMDITWDDPYPDNPNYVSYRYFLRTDKELKSYKKNPHYGWDSEGIKCTSKTYSKIPTASNRTLFYKNNYWYYTVKSKSNSYTYYRYNFKFTSKKKLVTSYISPKKYQSRIYYAPKKNQISSMNITGSVKRKLKKLPSYSKLTSISIKNNKVKYNYKRWNRKKIGSFKLTKAMKSTKKAAPASVETSIACSNAPAVVTPSNSTAISTTSSGISTSISPTASKLSSTQVNALYDGLKKYKTTVDLRRYKINAGDLQSLLDQAFTKDYYVQDSISWLSITPVSLSGRYVSKIKISYKYSKSTMQKRYNALKKAVAKAKATIGTNLTDLEAAIAIHDYIIQTATFHKQYADNMETKANFTPNYTYHSAYGILCKKTGVCSGYAYAYRLLLDEYNIDSVFIESEPMNHGWNMIKLGNSWYHVDVTWDDPDANPSWTKKNSGDLVYYDYFLLTNSEISASEHYNWEPFKKSSSKTYSQMPRGSSDTQKFYKGKWYAKETLPDGSGYQYVCYTMNGQKSLIASSVSPFYTLENRIIYQPDKYTLLSMNQDGTQTRSLTEMAIASGIPLNTPFEITGLSKNTKTLSFQYELSDATMEPPVITTGTSTLTFSDYDLRTTDYATSLTISKTKATVQKNKSFTLKASIGPDWPLLNNKVVFKTSQKGSKIVKIYRIKNFSCQIKGIKKGTANVYVKVPNTSLSAKCQVKVK